MPHPFRHIIPAVAFISSAVLLTIGASAQTMGSPERYTASAININNGRAGTIDITVDRWSTDKQRDTLMAAMIEKGPEKLLDTVQELPRVGHFGAPGNLSWDIHFARKMPLPDGGERVVLITDRRIGFWESVNRPRSIDYPFTVIELRLNQDGQGEGKLSVAAKVIYEKEQNMITLENYQLQPVQLTNIKREKVTH